MSWYRGRLAGRYIFSEMLPGFIMGVLVFVFILLIFQALRLAEFVIVHDVDLQTVGRIVVFLTVSFLPAILPMSLLFTVLLTYGRMSHDSEIVAFKSVGLNMVHITAPAVVLAVLVGAASAQTTFELGPWGNRQFEVLFTELADSKVAETLRSGTFSEGFFDLVVYANEINPKTSELKNVFIYDSRDDRMPVTIIAEKGLILRDPDRPKLSSTLRLINGNIHRSSEQIYTKVDFQNYDISLSLPSTTSVREKSPPSLTFSELIGLLKATDIPQDKRLTYQTEFHKRMAIPVACVIFSLLAVGLGTTTNRRSARSSGFVLCLGILVSFWTLYVAGESMARNGLIPPWIAIWTSDLAFFLLSLFYLRKAARQ